MSKSLKKIIDINRLREFKNKLVGTGSAYVQTGAVDQTVAGTKTFSKPIVGSVTGSSGSCTGNAATATKAVSADSATNASHATSADKATKAEQDGNGNIIVASYVAAGSEDSTTDIGAFMAARPSFIKSFIYNDLWTDAISMRHRNGGADGDMFGTYIRSSNMTGVSNLLWNHQSAGNWQGERTLVDSANLADFIKSAVTSLDASKLTGTASVSTTGNAATATTATTATNATNADHATKADSATRATSADRASVANCVQAGDYHEIRFDWGSQVPGYVGLRVDATGMGGIVTTNRLVSDIRAQWYAAYPDGAEAHNAMWGGRDITAAFDAGTVSANIANGTFKDIFPGDYITKQVTISGTTYTVNWVVADCDYWINKGDQDNGMETHHVVIVPQVPIFDANMNTKNTTAGGYAGSAMYKNVIPACATGIVSAFGSEHILTFRDGISNSVDTSYFSSGLPQYTGTPVWWGTWVSAQCNLMSEKMVFGAPVCSAGAMDNTMATRQMSAFRLSERLINYNRQGWWLRDVASHASFAHVYGYGYANLGYAYNGFGVRPFALLR